MEPVWLASWAMFSLCSLGALAKELPKMAKYPFHYVLNLVGNDSVCKCEGVCKCSPSSMNISEELQLTLLLRLGLRRYQIHLP